MFIIAVFCFVSIFSTAPVFGKCKRTYSKMGLKMTPNYPEQFEGNCTFTFPPKKGVALKFTVTADNSEDDEIYAIFEDPSITPILINRGFKKPATVYAPVGTGLRMIFIQPRAVLVDTYLLEKENKYCPFPLLNITDAPIQLDLSRFPKTGCAVRLQSSRNISIATDCAVIYVSHPGNKVHFLRYDPADLTKFPGHKISVPADVDAVFIPTSHDNCTISISQFAETIDPCIYRSTVPIEIPETGMSKKVIPEQEALFSPDLYNICSKFTVHYLINCTNCGEYTKEGNYWGLKPSIPHKSKCGMRLSNETKHVIEFGPADGGFANFGFFKGTTFDLEITCTPILNPTVEEGFFVGLKYFQVPNDCVCPPYLLNDSSKIHKFIGKKHCTGFECYFKLPPKNKTRKIEINYHFLDDDDGLYIITSEGPEKLSGYTVDEEIERNKPPQPLTAPPKQKTLILPPNEGLSLIYFQKQWLSFRDIIVYGLPVVDVRTHIYREPVVPFPGIYNVTWQDVDDE